MLLPVVAYAFLSSTINDYNNKTFRFLSIILTTIVVIGIIFTIFLNSIISKKRISIYNNIVKKDGNYSEGIKKLEKLVSIPQSRLNVGNTLLYIVYTKLFEEKYEEALILFDEIKQFNIKFKLGYKNNALASYYKILIYLLFDKKHEIEKEIEYFNSIKRKLNNNIFSIIINCIEAIENINDINLIYQLSKQNNVFIDKVIDKIKSRVN